MLLCVVPVRNAIPAKQEDDTEVATFPTPMKCVMLIPLTRFYVIRPIRLISGHNKKTFASRNSFGWAYTYTEAPVTILGMEDIFRIA